MLTMSFHNNRSHLRCTIIHISFLGMDYLNIIHSASALNKWSIEGGAYIIRIYSSRHYYDMQVRSYYPLCLAYKSKGCVGSKTALVKLVEHHNRHAFERGVINKHPKEYALGNHLNTGGRTDFCIKPYTIAHCIANTLANHCRHSLGYLYSCNTTRFDNEHTPFIHSIKNGKGQ